MLLSYHHAVALPARPLRWRQVTALRGSKGRGKVKVAEDKTLQAGEAERLLAQVATRGDRAAFAQLFGHYAPRLKSFLLRQGCDGGAAEELVQETLLTLWRNASRFDATQASVSTWVFTIARNKRIDRLRRERGDNLNIDDFTFVSADEPADQALSGRQEAQAVRRALQALPPEQAELVVKSYFDEQPHSEIAAALHLPLGTVKSRLRLALTRLRKIMKEEA